MGNLFTDLFTSDNEEKAAQQKIAGINAGISGANSALDTGLGAATGLYDKGYADFSSLGAKFGKGQDLYNDATGVNGADAAAKAAAIYKSLPGYSGGLTTGTDQLMRTAAARGDLGGGNTSADIIKFASDYDANKYQSFLSALAPNLSGATAATTGGAGILSNEAAANLGVGSQKAGIQYGGNTAIGNANADATMAAENSSKNFWGALMGGANLLTKAFPGGFGGGGSGQITLGGSGGPMPFY